MMTAFAGYDPRRSTGYRLEQLATAFDRVRDPADWQAPVWAVIVADERPLVEMAVRWFTESEPVFDRVPGSEELLVVKAAGYRLGDGERKSVALMTSGAKRPESHEHLQV